MPEGTKYPPEHEGDLPELTEANRQYLLNLARTAVERQVQGRPPEKPEYDDPVLSMEWGAFVTLRIGGDLRGCIGAIVSDEPLPETILDMAVKSATVDPRFAPIGPAELDDLEIDISILGPLSEVMDIDEIIIGLHGLVIESGARRGLLLPQVATEHGLDVLEFLAQTCLKAGLPLDAWRKGAKIYKFPARYF